MHQLPLSLSRFPFTLASFLAATAVIPSVRPPACLPASSPFSVTTRSLARPPAHTRSHRQTTLSLARSILWLGSLRRAVSRTGLHAAHHHFYFLVVAPPKRVCCYCCYYFLVDRSCQCNRPVRTACAKTKSDSV